MEVDVSGIFEDTDFEVHPTVVNCVEIMLLFFGEIFSVFSVILKASVSSLSYSEIGVDLSRGLPGSKFVSSSRRNVVLLLFKG